MPLHTFRIVAAIFTHACVAVAYVTCSFCSFFTLNMTRLGVFYRRRTFSTADSSRAAPGRLYLFGFFFLGKSPVLPLFLIFMNPSLPAHKSSRHRNVSISLVAIQGTIMNQTQRHNLFRPHVIDVLFLIYFFAF